ncbi:MAG: STAS domain-containing protein [Spirochaetaceae bacterium]|jgi:anti-anti-sigma factor|nr:STAS domain-containing protein [Spirochaetaceae bacterium]
MNIELTKSGEESILALCGRLDTQTAPQLESRLIPLFDSAKDIILDFEKLDYISSAGLRVVLMGEKIARIKSAKFSLLHVSENIMEILKVTGLLDILTIKT